MDNLISTTYNIVGVDLEHHATTVRNLLDATAGVVEVDIDLEKKEARISSTVELEIATLEEALADTDYYITVKTDNNWVAPPSFRKVAEQTRQKHNSSRNIEGVSDGAAKTGPVTDYDGD